MQILKLGISKKTTNILKLTLPPSLLKICLKESRHFLNKRPSRGQLKSKICRPAEFFSEFTNCLESLEEYAQQAPNFRSTETTSIYHKQNEKKTPSKT